MKKSSYKNHLDRIKCSDDFRAKMERLLIAETDGEYQDSVSHVEYAPKRNINRWGAIAASFIFVVGFCGFAAINIKDNIDMSHIENSDISISEAEEAQAEKKFSDYSIALSVMGAYDTIYNHYQSFGALPDDAVNEIMEEFEKWQPIENCDILYDANPGGLTFVVRGAESYTLKLNSTGLLYKDCDGVESEEYYPIEMYTSLCGIIAKYLPYCDWNCIADDGYVKKELAEIFEKYKNEIEIIDNFEPEYNMRFFGSALFGGLIEKDGRFNILYDNEKKSVSFKASPEFYEDIEECMFRGLIERISFVDTLCYVVTKRKPTYYSEGQDPDFSPPEYASVDYVSSVLEADLTSVFDAIERINWKKIKYDSIPVSYYEMGLYLVSIDGSEIYDRSRKCLYIAENQDTTAIAEAIENVIASNKAANLLKIIIDSDNIKDNKRIEGNFEYNYKTEDLTDPSISCYLGGKGYTVIDFKEKSQYTMIIDEETDYCAELSMQNSEWHMLESGKAVEYFRPKESNSRQNVDGTITTYSENAEECTTSGEITNSSNHLIYETIRRRFYNYLTSYNINKSKEDILEYEQKDGITTGHLEVVMGTLKRIVDFTLDENGNIIQLDEYNDNENNTEQVVHFRIGDGAGNGIIYNSESDFTEIPTLADND